MKILILLFSLSLSACGMEKTLTDFAEKCRKEFGGKASVGVSHNGFIQSVVIMCERKD